MSTAHQSTIASQSVSVPLVNVPPLETGDHLTRAEFERRYGAMPYLKKAELIEGIVYMPSPVRHAQHGKPHATVIGWITYYCGKTVGVDFGCESTNRLDDKNEPQPDVVMLLPQQLKSSARVDDDGYIAGAPDLVAEIAASSVSIDLHEKKNVYCRHGVREYLVVRTQDNAVDWFELIDGVYAPKHADDQGRLRSKVFPGLWLDPAALLAGDLPTLFTVVDEGTKSDDHREFVKRLAAETT